MLQRNILYVKVNVLALAIKKAIMVTLGMKEVTLVGEFVLRDCVLDLTIFIIGWIISFYLVFHSKTSGTRGLYE